MKFSRVTIKRCYLDRTSTLLLPFFFITSALVVYLQKVPLFSIKAAVEASSTDGHIFLSLLNLVYGFYIAVVGIMYGCYKLLRRKILKDAESRRIEKIEPFIIDKNNQATAIQRDVHLKKLDDFFERSFKNNNKYAFITGKSGKGKSLLLYNYEAKNNSDTRAIKIFSISHYIGDENNRLVEELKTITEESKNTNNRSYLVIFDQFERVVHKKKVSERIYHFLEETKNNTAISIVFVCMNHDYLRLARAIKDGIKNKNHDFQIPYYEVNFLDEEKKRMFEQLEVELNLEAKPETNKFIKKVLDDLSADKVSMLELSIVRKYFKRNPAEDTYLSIILNHDTAMGKIVENHFKTLFSRLEDEELGMIILYSLCCDKNYLGKIIPDFQNLTFASKSSVKKILDRLTEQAIIKKVINDGNEYIITHSYLSNYLENYCKSRLSEQIVLNIDFYCHERDKQHDILVLKKHDMKYTPKLSEYYKKSVAQRDKNSDRVIKQKSCKVIDFYIWTLCISIFSICAWYEIKGYGAIEIFNWRYVMTREILCLTILSAGCVIFYAYHYLYYFARIFFCKRGCAEYYLSHLLPAAVTVLSILAFLINGLWLSFIAAWWLLVGALHFVLSKKDISNENARVRLGRECFLYVVIAFGLIAVNTWLLLSDTSVYPWFGIFILFTTMLIRQHINTDFMLSKLINFTGIELREG
jgi:hypothetical protein